MKLFEKIQCVINDKKLQNYKVILPSKKACIELRKIVNPKVIVQTLENFLEDITGVQLEEQLNLIKCLYDIKASFKNFPTKLSTFEQFFECGSILLKDFENIEASLLDTKKLFITIKNIKLIDENFNYLSAHERKVIKQYWSNFKNVDSINKKHFLYFWELLPIWYDKFNNFISNKNKASKSFLYNLISKKIDCDICLNKKLENQQIIIAGFSILKEIEKKLFKYLYKKYSVHFIWNFDAYYKNNPDHPLYKFSNTNLNLFPDTFKENHSIIRANIKVVETNYISEQIEYLIKELIKNKNIKQTIIVYNEKVQKILVDSLEYYNIHFTVNNNFLQYDKINSFIEKLIEIQIRVNNKKDISLDYNFNQLESSQIYKILNNYCKERTLKNYFFSRNEDIIKIITFVLNTLKIILEKSNNSDLVNDNLLVAENINLEFKHVLILDKIIKKIENLYSERQTSKIANYDFLILYRKLVCKDSKENKGQDDNGIAILNFEETISVDFDKVYILNFTSEVFKNKTNTYIPFSLKKIYNISENRDFNDISNRHLFLSFIQRSKDITIFNNKFNINNTKLLEPNKFLLELLYNKDINIEILKFKKNIHFLKNNSIVENKTLSHINIITDNGISATALNTYLDCHLKFYFKYIKKIKKDFLVDEIIAFGDILHKSLNTLFKKKNIIQSYDIVRLEENISSTLENILHDSKYEKIESLKILKEALKLTINKILAIDKQYAPYEILGIEARIKKAVMLKNNNLTLWGIADRIDKKNDTLRVIDYKTGNYNTKINSLKSLFEIDNDNRNRIALQILLYCFFLDSNTHIKSIEPTIAGIKDIFENNKFKKLELKVGYKYENINFRNIKEEFTNLLTDILGEIVDIEVPFSQTPNTNICEKCEYNSICCR